MSELSLTFKIHKIDDSFFTISDDDGDDIMNQDKMMRILKKHQPIKYVFINKNLQVMAYE